MENAYAVPWEELWNIMERLLKDMGEGRRRPDYRMIEAHMELEKDDSDAPDPSSTPSAGEVHLALGLERARASWAEGAEVEGRLASIYTTGVQALRKRWVLDNPVEFWWRARDQRDAAYSAALQEAPDLWGDIQRGDAGTLQALGDAGWDVTTLRKLTHRRKPSRTRS